jgi:hypothetical protein
MTAMHNTDRAVTSRSSLRIAGRGGFFRSLALTASIFGSLVAQATETPQPLSLRNSNPLLQTLGAPAMQGGELAPAGTLEYRWILNMANHADSGLDDGEAAVFDGESYYLALELRYGVNPRLELGMDLPLVAHTGGTFDSLIKDWHDLLGFSNVDRQGPENDLRLFHQRNGVTGFDIYESGVGLGDIRLAAAYRLAGSGGRALALRAQAELPTGDADRLHGNGAVDLSLVLDATDRHTFAASRVSLFGRFGVVAPGSGDLLNDQRQDWVPVVGAGLAWQWTERIDLNAQLDYDGAYFDSHLDELESSTRLSFGGSYRFGQHGPRLSIALTENLFSDSTPDFGLYFSLTNSR